MHPSKFIDMTLNLFKAVIGKIIVIRVGQPRDETMEPVSWLQHVSFTQIFVCYGKKGRGSHAATHTGLRLPPVA